MAGDKLAVKIYCGNTGSAVAQSIVYVIFDKFLMNK